MVITNDLKDFFPSISNRNVYDVFLRRLGCKPDIARYLTKLTTIDGCLPQAPHEYHIICIGLEPLAKTA